MVRGETAAQGGRCERGRDQLRLRRHTSCGAHIPGRMLTEQETGQQPVDQRVRGEVGARPRNRPPHCPRVVRRAHGIVGHANAAHRTRDDLSALQVPGRPGGGRRPLEIGCGTGLGNHLLAASVAELFSFDLEYDNVDNGRRNAPGEFGCTDAQALPFSSESLDVVAACEMIYYVPDHERMLAEIRRSCAQVVRCSLRWPTPNARVSTTLRSARSTPAPVGRPRCCKHGFEPELYGVSRCRTHHGRGCCGSLLGSPRSSISFRRRLPAAVS